MKERPKEGKTELREKIMEKERNRRMGKTKGIVETKQKQN